MAKKVTNKRVPRTIICTFCLDDFTPDKIWWVEMSMHRTDPNCTSKYAVPSCEKCKDHKDNSWMIIGIHEEPKIKKPTKKQIKE